MNSRPFWLAVALLASGIFLVVEGQQPNPTRVFTSAQAKAGRVAYEKTCGRCHTVTLMGRKGDSSELPPLSSLSDSDRKFIGARGYTYVPPLAGPDFLDRWGSSTAAQLIERFKVTALASSFGFEGMNDEVVVNITAYVLQVNGAKAGERPLSLTTNAVVNSL